ncbi:MAG: antibiotic biosynthesis monooxygenase [Kiloniellales bacterium]
MSGYVSWVLDLELLDGKDAEFRELMAEMVAATKADEPGTLAYEWSLDESGKVCSIYERYVDSDAVMVHMASFGANYAKRFLSVFKPSRLVVFGSPNAAVKQALAALSPIYMTQVGGFSRH